MKKLMLLAALLAMLVVAAVPAIAQVEQTFDEQEAESGEVEQSFTVGGEGDNGSQCVGINGTANTGNAQNQIGVLQYASETEEFEFEEIQSNVTFEDVASTTTCDQQVNQAAAASGK